MTIKNQLLQMIDIIPEGELPIILEVVRRFVPVDVDDIATDEDFEAHRIAMKEFESGETISDDAINWN